MKFAGYILAAMGVLSLGTLARGAVEVSSYSEGYERVGDDGWVLLCHSADWDESHDAQWIRRQSSISSSCGNALILYVPVYQNPSPEQEAEVARILQGAAVDLSTLRSLPCALLLDASGRPYATISGDEFIEQAAGLIRHYQSQLRSRRNLERRSSQEEGSQKAQTLSSIWRLNIAPTPNLKRKMAEADPEDSAGIAEISPFDPWALAERVYAMPWQEAIDELDRIQKAQLSKEERQMVLAIRLGCVRRHLGAAGVKEIRRLANVCTGLAPGTPLGKAAQRAAELWGNRLDLSSGWAAEQLPRIPANCEIAGVRELARDGEYRIGIVPTRGADPVRVTRVALYDDDAKVSEDSHLCCLKPGDPLVNNEYMLIVRSAPSSPRLVITFDQQGKTDTQGLFTVRYFTTDGLEVKTTNSVEAAMAAAAAARKEMEERKLAPEEKSAGATNGQLSTGLPPAK